MKEKRSAQVNHARAEITGRFKRIAQFTFASMEFAAVTAVGLVKAGRTRLGNLFTLSRKRKVAPDTRKSEAKKTVVIKTEAEKKIELEEQVAQFDKRLQNLEKRLQSSHKEAIVLGNGKVAVEIEQYNLLVELARITKSYINSSGKK